MKKLIASTVPTPAPAAIKNLTFDIAIALLLLAGTICFGTEPPSVTTLPAQSILASSATLRGAINESEGAPEVLERGIEWTKNFRRWGIGKEGVDFGFIGNDAITVDGNEFFAIENRFAPHTRYRYRVFARDEFGWSDTNAVNVESFTTPKRILRISLSGDPNFGSVNVGDTTTRTLIISNVGNAPVTVVSVTPPHEFFLTFNQSSLQPNDFVSVPIRFIPALTGDLSGPIVVRIDARPQTSTIYATGMAMYRAPLPAARALPAEAITPVSAILRGIVDSDGGTAIVERQIEWVRPPGKWNNGEPGVDFGDLAGADVKISGNEFFATERRFVPGTVYNFRVKVRNGGWWAPVTNIETFSTPRISRPIFLSGNLDFGTVAVGESATRMLTISNGGNSALSVSSITLPEGFTAGFSGAIAPTNSADVEVTFTPPAGGPFGGELKVVSDATAGKTNYFTSGTGDAGPPVPVSIVGHPSSVTVLRGTPVDFGVATAGGLGPLTFQWLLNGTPIARATSPQLHYKHINPKQAGSYSVTVFDGVTSVVSSNATLTVIDIRILKSPRDRSVHAGDRATFSVSAVGPAPMTYQWLFNGAPIDGATERTFTIEDVQEENVGLYSVQITNPTGSTVTEAATLGIR